MAINDWSSIQSLFDKLNKQLEKTQKVAEQAVLPRVYIRLLVELEVSRASSPGAQAVCAGTHAPSAVACPTTPPTDQSAHECRTSY